MLVKIRRQGAQNFMAYYDFACARQESVPLPIVKMNLDKGILDFNGDRLKLTDWPPILSSISINKHLQNIAISSTYQASLGSGDADRRYYKSSIRKKIPAICSKDMTFKLCKALRECLTVSPNLKTLQLNGLLLRERDLITLTKGLAKSVSLENLSLANCPITDEGLEVICQSVKYSTSIRTVDFTGCNLTWRGAEHMANIIKHQGMQRHGTAWAESLRYRQPQFEGMGGLRRITLNCNTLIGDRGAAALAHELTEDLWVKAVDLQRCGLSNEGARRLLEALKTNSTLCVLDIRSNPLVDKVLIKTIIEKVLMNADGQSPEYCWIKPAATETQRASGPKRAALPSTNRGKTTFRIECRLRLAEKRRARLRAESRLMEYELENGRLRDANHSLSEALAATGSASAPPTFSALEDEAVLESIESSFTKFHAFLDLLRDAGLGQLASLAGIDKSDFQPLGRPQLSSTVGPHLDGAASVSRGEEYRDVQAKTCALLSLCSQKSFDKVSFGKTFQTQPRSHKSNSNSHHSNSHHSNSSHGYSFSNNHGHSRRSQDSGSHCGLSARSNVSDVMSEKAESVGSVGSKNRGKGRLVTGQSGSEGSEGKSYPGRSLDSLVGQSDNESF
uniref:Centrosomal protein 78 n=1 Tax=Anabas testudineus TaxID=64144 RepID=A0A7N6C0K4_ANATE